MLSFERKNESLARPNVKNGVSGGFPAPVFFRLRKIYRRFRRWRSARANTSGKCTGNYCLRSPTENLPRFVKGLSRSEAFPQVVHESTDSPVAFHDNVELRAQCCRKRTNFITICSCVIFAECLLFLFNCYFRTKRCLFYPQCSGKRISDPLSFAKRETRSRGRFDEKIYCKI